MRAEMRAAERAREVRDAARAWEKAGFTTNEVTREVIGLYPDDRGRLGPGFRTLVFIFAWMAGTSCTTFLFIPFSMLGSTGWALMMGVYGLMLAALTEYQIGPLKRMDAGAESATGLMATGYTLAGLLWFLIEVTHLGERPAVLLGLTVCCAWCATAAWRWGERIYFIGAFCCLLLLLAQGPAPRLLWMLAGGLGAWEAARASRDEKLSPGHRKGAAYVAGCALLALYAAVHIGSVDSRLIEELRIISPSTRTEAPGSAVRNASVLATGLLPVALMAMGWRLRRSLLLNIGLLLLGASVITIRAYREVMPLGSALVLIGAVCLLAALGLRRWLRGGPAGERNGFTADPLLDDTNRTEVIETALKVATFTPAARAAPEPPAFQGGGGSFGGGGASTSF